MSNIPILPLLTAKVLRRFWSKVDRGASDECWPWLAGKINSGYGKFKICSYTDVLANRVAYAAHYVIDPDDSLVLHSCDSPPCCNPGHLFLGTDADNAADKVSKGRCGVFDRSGENNGRAILTVNHISQIREQLSSGSTNVDIAKQFGVTHQMISRIRRGKAWGVTPIGDKYSSIRKD